MNFNTTMTYQLSTYSGITNDLEDKANQDNYIDENKKDNIFVKNIYSSNYVNFNEERTNPELLKQQYANRIQVNKNKAIRLLKNEDIAIGYNSMTERFFNDLLVEDPSFLKDLLNHIVIDVFKNEEILQKFIEVMSNLDYDSLYPTNTILALGTVNHANVGVQEAALAAYEKWDDKRNLNILKNIKYTTGWIEKYAKEIIDYLESC